MTKEPFVSITINPLQDDFDMSQHYDLEYILSLFLKLLGDKSSKLHKALLIQRGENISYVGLMSEDHDLTLKTNCFLVQGDE